MQIYSTNLSDFMKHIRSYILFTVAVLAALNVYSQPGTDVELNKPGKYENRKLRSEKTGEKKFTLPRRITQNTFTHYNYYFNANNRLNAVVERAKAANKDDYSHLLPFYNYSLDATGEDLSELDSVIYKSTAGILLHDLRNDWIDNMYLVLAKAYFYKKDFDSAGMTLQYLNFAFAPKEAGGYDIPIGSNASNETGEFSISTNERASIFKKAISRPPSRNESFIWQIRNHIETSELAEAAGIIEILKNDPNFPKRLQTDLNQMISYWFYKQQVYDSSAVYLGKALNEADNRQEYARWEFLIGQMYQLANMPEDAIDYYGRSIRHTNDPVMDVYARLNSIRINRNKDQKDFLQQNITELLKLARKDKYENYRDIIYYAAAKMELERQGFAAAEEHLLKSVKYTNNNPGQRSESFLALADLNYDRKNYVNAYNYYDSTVVGVLSLEDDKTRATLRKPPLKTISQNSVAVYTQDSLQALAKLPEAQREAIVKKKSRELRKAQGYKDEDTQSSNPAVMQQTNSDLFADDSKSSDFYFYNASTKARGFSEFKSRWGQRPNVDNWRRQSSIRLQSSAVSDVVDVPGAAIAGADTINNNITYEGLLNTLPLTEEKVAASNKTIVDALYSTAQTFQNKLEDYPSAIEAWEELLRRFPYSDYTGEAMFNLVYCYRKTGNVEKSDAYAKQLLATAPTGKYSQMLKNPASTKTELANNPATKKYEEIYNLFLEGNFERAKNEKKAADSVYGKNYWTPQLLYIEAIYYIKQREDSTALKSLRSLTTLYRGTPMADKAFTMIDVLGRRLYIEDYLTKLEITRAEERPNTTTTNTQPAITTPVPPVKKDSVVAVVVPPVKKEPIKKADSVVAAPPVIKNFTFVATDPQFVVVLLDKVDEVYASEARNAFNRYNREKLYNQKIDLSSLKLDDRFQLVLQGPFTDASAAVTYVENVKPIAGSRIVPWLSRDKYSFLVISAANLELLKTNKDMAAYRQLLQQAFPGKF